MKRIALSIAAVLATCVATTATATTEEAQMSIVTHSQVLEHGQFGFTAQLPPQNQSFVLPALHASASGLGVTFGVHLAAWQGASVQRNATGVKFLHARITYAGGGNGGTGTEVVEIDYPAAGTTVNVTGNSVRVEIVGSTLTANGSDIPPIVGGWLTLGTTNERPMSATLTTDKFTIPAGSGQPFDVPPRARAFRVFFAGGGHQITLLQLTGNATPEDLQNDLLGFNAVTATDGGDTVPEFLAENRATWYPLSPRAASIVASNLNNGTGAAALAIQFLLELN